MPNNRAASALFPFACFVRPLSKPGSCAIDGTTVTNAASPLDIVRERYARGEINHDECERMKQHLS